jgi:7-cyano-7-deazaguanine synthase
MAGPRAVALLSGGIDSATAAAIVKAEGKLVFPLAVRYGQRHAVELEAAARVARMLGLEELRVVEAGLRAIGGSALTSGAPVPKDRPIDATIPVTYVPARNAIFLSLALGHAEVLGAFELVIGANALDYSGYPDCRGPFLAAFEAMANVATRAGVEGRGRFRVRAPLLDMTKAQIIRRAAELGVPLAETHSCYDPAADGRACGRCDSCQLRRRGFAEAGIADPTRYA